MYDHVVWNTVGCSARRYITVPCPPSMAFTGRSKRLVQPEADELGNGIKRLVLQRIAQVEGVIYLRHAHVDVQPLERFVGRVIDAVRMAHAVRHARRALKQRCAAIDRKLRLAIEDHEHLFAPVMEVLADAAVRVDYAAMEEDQVRLHCVRAQHHAEAHGARSIMHRRLVANFRWVIMRDAVLNVSGRRSGAPDYRRLVHRNWRSGSRVWRLSEGEA